MRDSRWHLDRSDRPQPALVDFLESVEFGGSGLRYRRKELADTLRRLAPSRFISICDRDRLVGTYILTPTRVDLAGESVPADYRGLLAVALSHRRQGIGRRLVEAALDHAQASAAGEPRLSFGLIESGNEASLRLLEAYGGKRLGTLESQLVYRQLPRSSPSLRRLDFDEAAAYTDELQRLESGSGVIIRSAAELPLYALVAGSRIRAAARVGISTIDLGPGGALARFLHRYAYGRFDVLRKRYNRRAFRYLTIHDPLVSAEPEAFEEFTNALLAQFAAHMALFTLDPGSEDARRLASTGLFGRFSRLTRQELQIIAHSWNLPDERFARAAAGPIIGGPVY